MHGKLIPVLLFVTYVSFAADPSQYIGEESRAIKSLSAQEVDSLRRGDGMGFAKLAELNHYPGPKHVLDVSDELGLSPTQIVETEFLFEQMQSNAVALGEELIAAESRLGQDFADKSVTPQTLEAALLKIGNLRARLRYVHLEAHLRQAQLLSADQIARYDSLRGYQDAAQDHSHHAGSHNWQFSLSKPGSRVKSRT